MRVITLVEIKNIMFNGPLISTVVIKVFLYLLLLRFTSQRAPSCYITIKIVSETYYHSNPFQDEEQMPHDL